ncbi:MAG: reverse transcriptase family protein, partial [Bacteroidota bacterium]
MDRLIQGLEGNRKTAGGEKLKRSDGSFTNSDKERNEELKSFFSKEVFGRVSSYDESALDEIDDREIDFQLNTPPSFEEFSHHVQTANRHRAPGPNQINTEMYQLLDDFTLHYAYNEIVKYWTDPDFDIAAWHKVKLSPIPKKTNPTQAKDYRPISLLDVLSKVLSSIIASRLNDHMLKVGLPEQAGFTKGRSCADAIAALKIALEQQRNANKDTYVLFLDLVKAFDSVNRELPWKIL